jgi:CRP-like cAMP-binding protein
VPRGSGAAVQTCLLPLANSAPCVAYTGLHGDGSKFEIAFSVGSSEGLAADRTELLSKVHRHLRHAGSPLAVAGTANPPAVPTMTIADSLERSDLFGMPAPEERGLLAQHFVATALNIGDTLIGQGEMPQALFLIVAGTAEVTRKEAGIRHLLARLGPGESLGLVGMFTGPPTPPRALRSLAWTHFVSTNASVAMALGVCPNMAVRLEALARRRERSLVQENALHEDAQGEHADAFLLRVRQVLHRLAA